MSTDRFWRIIESTRAATQEEQLKLFRDQLQLLSPRELIEFERVFVEHSFAAYSWDLWLVAWLCQGGMCSDDGFMDFRSWLISRGRATYETALAHADSLADEMRQTEHPEFELFGYVPNQTYRARTGEDFPSLAFQHPKEPCGGDWLRPALKDRAESKILNRCVVFREMGDEEFAAIEQRFPRVWQLCVERGIITTVATPRPPSTLPTVEQITATVDPNLETTDFAAYLKALGDSARQAYKND
jgi:hypothetical protein